GGGGVGGGMSGQGIFGLNVRMGLVLLPLCLTFLPESFAPRPRLDLAGLALVSTGLLGITWGLVRANSVGWSSAEVVLSLIAGAVLLGSFLAWERRRSEERRVGKEGRAGGPACDEQGQY